MEQSQQGDRRQQERTGESQEGEGVGLPPQSQQSVSLGQEGCVIEEGLHPPEGRTSLCSLSQAPNETAKALNPAQGGLTKPQALNTSI